jgi:mRNA interferase MazF
MRRGEVWIANLNPNKGSETGKVRPVVILQEIRLIEAGLPTVIVIPLTTQLRKGLEPLRVPIAARDRLEQDCHVMTEQIRALDRARIGVGPLTKLSAQEMADLERSLRVTLALGGDDLPGR